MLSNTVFFRLLNFWPPFLGAGIRVKKVAKDLSEIDIEMGLHFYNRNYVGTHFGGSLYAMVDPFLMLMLSRLLGRDYVVWDKSASIRYKQPGRGMVYAKFRVSEAEVQNIRESLEKEAKVEPEFEVLVTDQKGEVVAIVRKLLHITKR